MRDKLIPSFILLLLAIIVYLSQEQWLPYLVQWWDWLSDNGDEVGLLDSLLAIIGGFLAAVPAYFAFFGRSNEDNEPDEPDEADGDGNGNGNGVSAPAATTTPVTVNLQLDGIVNEVRSRVRQDAAPNPHHAPALRREDVEKARADYLDLLAQRCNVLPLAALGGQEGMGEEVKLDEVYVALDTTSRVALTEQEKQQDQYRRIGAHDRALTALEVATEQRRLVLLGDQGSGKSTFVRQLVARAARACDQGQAFSEGWQAGLLPVLVVGTKQSSEHQNPSLARSGRD